MSCEVRRWAMGTDKARSPFKRLILLGIGGVADEFGVAMKNGERLRVFAVASPVEFVEALLGLIERRVVALVPSFATACRDEVGALGFGRPSAGLCVVLTGWEDREILAPGDEQPLLGEVILP